MNRDDNIWVVFFVENFQWFIASIFLAFGIWIIAVLQTDPIQQRDYPRQVAINYQLADDLIITDSDNPNSAIVTVRAPRSVWDELRTDQIEVWVDLRDRRAGTQTVALRAQLQDDLRGEVVEISPAEVEITLEEITTQRIPIRTTITQEPPSGYTYPPPSCDLSEVTASGPNGSLENATAVARINLSEERNPVSLTVNLFTADENGQLIRDVTLQPAQVTCDVEVSQQDGVSELIVVPTIEGIEQLPEGYIYQGYQFEPQTVVVTGSPSAIRNLSGVVSTDAIDLSNAEGNFDRTVSVQLPPGVRLLPDTQTITVSVQIGTLPGSRQFEAVAVQIENAPTDAGVSIQPEVVTVFITGPQPLIKALVADDLRVSLDVGDLEAGTYQLAPRATVAIEDLQEETTLTVQPSEISLTISPLEPDGE